MEKEIDFKECRHVTHKPQSTDRSTGVVSPDLHYVKEKITYKDGTTENKLRIFEDFKRNIWITRKEYRNHKLKRESELVERTYTVETTESEKWERAAHALGVRCYDPTAIKDSPYLYGADVKAGVFLKRLYQQKYPDKFTPYEVACLDIEKDVDEDEITVITIVFKNKIYTVIKESFIERFKDPIKDIKLVASQHMPNYKDYEIEVKIIKSEVMMIVDIFKQLNIWEPDLLAIWNMDYDLSAILDVLKKHDIPPENVFSHPSVPKEHRYFKYKKAMEFKVSSSGKKKASEVQDRWHVVACSSIFYWVDAMVVYNYVRVNTKNVPTGYGLDSILNHEMGEKFKKLKFQHLNDGDYIQVDWHRFMSKNHPIEYIVYNMWDAMSMLVLDNHTRDMVETFPILSDMSMFEDFSSGPVRCLNALLFFYLERGRVVGTKPKNFNERRTMGLSGYIVALPNKFYMSRVAEGVLNDDKKRHTNVAQFVYDLDQVSAYPMDQITLNSSGDTTMLELVEVEGKNKDLVIQENVNLFTGLVSSLGYGREIFNLPSLYLIDTIVKERMKDGNHRQGNSREDNQGVHGEECRSSQDGGSETL